MKCPAFVWPERGGGERLILEPGNGQDPYPFLYGSVDPDPYNFGQIRIYTDSVFIRIFFSTYP
jgi:hypothetical protein